MDEKIKELLEQINSEFMGFPYSAGANLIRVRTKDSIAEALDAIRENLHCLSMRIKEAAEEANANMLKLFEYQQSINAVRRIFGLKG